MVSQQRCFAIDDISSVAAVRRDVLCMAAALDFDEVATGRLGVVVTEAATNIVKHAHRGEILVRGLVAKTNAASHVATGVRARSNGLEIIALDRGSGIADLEASMRDGVSTSGTSGSGLGAMRRLADRLDIYTQPGRGSAFYMAVFSGAAAALQPPEAWQLGVISLPKPGEDCCGDLWYFSALEQPARGAVLAVADGLGHGPDAAKAARAALGAVADGESQAPVELLDRAHQRARATRGAAVAVAVFTHDETQLQYAAVGNVACCICDGGPRRALLNSNGTVGHRLPKLQSVAAEWPVDALLIMYSDGISTQWNLEQYPGLLSRHPALVAAVLYRDFGRRTDDTTVIVIRRGRLLP